MSFEEAIKQFVKSVLGNHEVDWEQTDLDRVFLKDTPLFIRMWNLTNTYIDYTIYRPVGDAAEAVRDGYFTF